MASRIHEFNWARARTAFLSDISHEFRTPLAHMLRHIEDLLQRADSSLADIREELDAVYRNSLRLLPRINSLLVFSRTEAARRETSCEPIDLPAITAELAGAFRSTLERAGLRLSVERPPPEEPGQVDRAMWEKIVLNLLSNTPRALGGIGEAASPQTDSPTDTETVLLRVAANQAVAALQNARFLGSERRRAEEKLRRSEAQLAEGQRLSHTGSWEWSVSSGEVTLSRETSRILGFDPEQPAPSFDEAANRVHPDDRAAVNSVIQGAVRDGKEYEIECRLALPDGSVKHVHGIGRPLKNPSGAREFVGTLMDITERRRAEESLQAAQAQLAHVSRVTTMGELVASIAHEVNQPLAAVVANGDAALRWLLAAEPDLDEARAAAERIVKEANRASQVVAQIRSFLQKSEPKASALDVNELIHEVLTLTRHQILRAEVSLRTELANDLRYSQGDAVQLQQVILNLILNAIEALIPHAEGPREIVVASRNQGPDQIVVSVRDSGVGIEPGRIEEVFKPFVTSKHNGMGMGLSISRSIVEAHGGTLWALSNDDRGATLLFSLPAPAEIVHCAGVEDAAAPGAPRDPLASGGLLPRR